jgi:hypothetical protein
MMSPDEVARLALKVLPSVEAAVLAVAIAGAESGFRADAVGDLALADGTWGPSIGLWQIRSLKAQYGTGGVRDAARLEEPSFNAASMAAISRRGSYWQPWSVWKSGAYRARRAEAAAAVVAVSGQPWTPAIAAIRAEVLYRFNVDFAASKLRDGGVYNRRRVFNRPPPAPWSEHAWGNAWDVGCTPEAGDRLAAWARDEPSLVAQTLWRVAGHFDHVHLTGAPRRNPDGQRTPPPTVEDDVETIKTLQRALNAAGWKGRDGKPLTVDGVLGPNTEHALVAALAPATAPSDVLRRGDEVTVELVQLDRLAMRASVRLA